jgi:hypothetical protein
MTWCSRYGGTGPNNVFKGRGAKRAHLDSLQPGVEDLNGESVFEQEFIEDYERANVQRLEEGSLTAMLALVPKYKRFLDQRKSAIEVINSFQSPRGSCHCSSCSPSHRS